MRDLQQLRGLRRVGEGVIGARTGRALDADPRAAEHEQVEVELARAPPAARPAPERPLELLEVGEELECATRGFLARRDVERDDGVAEIAAGRSPPPARSHKRETPRRWARRRAASDATALVSVASASPTFAPRPMYARTRRSDTTVVSADAPRRRPHPPSRARPGRRIAQSVGGGRQIRGGRRPSARLPRGGRRRTRRSSPERLTSARSATGCATSLPGIGERPCRAGLGGCPAGDRGRPAGLRRDRGAERQGRPSPTTATRPTSWRSRARRPARPPRPPRRQRPAALARGGRRLPGRRPSRPLATRHRHRRTARPSCSSGRDGRARPAEVATVASAARRASIAVAADRRAELARRRSDVGCDAGAGSSATRRHASARWVEERGLRAASRLAQADNGRPRSAQAPGVRPRCAARARRSGRARELISRGSATRRSWIHACSSPTGSARTRRAGRFRGGSLRLRPAPAGTDRRSMAPCADRVRGQRTDPGRARRAYARGPGVRLVVGVGRAAQRGGDPWPAPRSTS